MDSLAAGGGGDRRFYGGSGADTLRGKEGEDSYFVGDAGSDSLFGGSANDAYFYGAEGDDTIRGNDGDDSALFGGLGMDTIFGGTGNDVINAENQADFSGYLYDGGPGTDTLILGAGVTIPGGGTGLVSIEVTL